MLTKIQKKNLSLIDMEILSIADTDIGRDKQPLITDITAEILLALSTPRI